MQSFFSRRCRARDIMSDTRKSLRLISKRQRQDESNNTMPSSSTRRQSQTPPPPPPPPAKKARKTPAEATRDWKLKMQVEDPDRWEEYLKKGRDYSKNYRESLTPEQRVDYNKKASARMRKSRANREKPRKTRAVGEEQRAIWRMQKQRQRQKKKEEEELELSLLSPQQLAQRKRQEEIRKETKRQNSKAAKKAESEQAAAAKKAESEKATRVSWTEPLVIDRMSESESEPTTSAPRMSESEPTTSAPRMSESEPTTSAPRMSESDSEPTTSAPKSTSPRTPEARRKALSRAKAGFPKNKKEFLETLQDLINQQRAMDSKKETIQHKVGQKVLAKLKSLKNDNTSLNLKRTLLSVCGKYGSLRSTATMLKVHRSTVAKRVTPAHSVSDSQKQTKERKMEGAIRDFLEAESTPLPHKKMVSSKTGRSTRVVSKPVRDLHSDFVASGRGEVSFSHFAKCRPPHVKTMQHVPLRMCLCEYCTNFELMLKPINTLATRIDNSRRIRHKYHAVDIITCGRQQPGISSWKKACALGECADCGLHQLDAHIVPLFEHGHYQKWQKWESVPTLVNGKTVLRKKLINKQGRWTTLLEEMRTQLSFLAAHLFRAEWQQHQFQQMKSQQPFPRGVVGMVLDFAENFTCWNQDEVQSAHWHHQQATVHPIVSYYCCETCGETVTESLVFISDDRQHDYNAVHAFTREAVGHLRDARGLTVEHLVQWTDGCASQYKSKGPFADISCALDDLGCTLERNFFGSRHGKGPSDGESAVVKHGAATAIKTGAALINDAKDLFDFCMVSKLNQQPTEFSCTHFRRSFFWVPSHEIARNRGRLVKTLKGTRSLHALKCVEQHVVMTRQLSCYCEGCKSGVGVCPNIGIAGIWEKQNLELVGAQLPTGPGSPNEPATTPPTNLSTPTDPTMLASPPLTVTPPAPSNKPATQATPLAELVTPPAPYNEPAAPPSPTEPATPPAAPIELTSAPGAPSPAASAPAAANQLAPAQGVNQPAPAPAAANQLAPAPDAADQLAPPAAPIELTSAPGAPSPAASAPAAANQLAPAQGVNQPAPAPAAANQLAPAPDTADQPAPPPDCASNQLDPAPAATDQPASGPDAADQPTSAPDAALQPRPTLAGSFVQVALQGRARNVFFFGKVLEEDESELHVHYFKEKGKGHVWSSKAWCSRDQLVKVVNSPRLAPGRGEPVFLFDN